MMVVRLMFKIAGVYVPQHFFEKLVEVNLFDAAVQMLGRVNQTLREQEHGQERDANGSRTPLEYEGKYQPLPDALQARLEAIPDVYHESYPHFDAYLAALIRVQIDEACVMTHDDIINSKPYWEIIHTADNQARIELATIVQKEIDKLETDLSDHKLFAVAIAEANLEVKVGKS